MQGEVAYDMEGNREQVMVLVSQYRFSDGEKTLILMYKYIHLYNCILQNHFLIYVGAETLEERDSSLTGAENCQIVAVINMEVFAYINGESNNSVWLGKYKIENVCTASFWQLI